jgi:hypothetical protein
VDAAVCVHAVLIDDVDHDGADGHFRAVETESRRILPTLLPAKRTRKPSDN